MDQTTQFVTVDTNLYQDPELIAIGRALPYIHLYATKVTEGEVGKEVVMGYHQESIMYGEAMWGEVNFQPNRAIPSVFTLDVSLLDGEDTLAGDDLPDDLMKKIFAISTNGSFQYPRDIHSVIKAQQNQYNDALILAAHCNRKHTILVSNDLKFFGRDHEDERRNRLEVLCKTRIMSAEEFKDIYGSPQIYQSV